MSITAWLTNRRAIKAENETVQTAIREIRNNPGSSAEARSIRRQSREVLITIPERAVPALISELQDGGYACEDVLAAIGPPSEEGLLEVLRARCDPNKFSKITPCVYHIMRALARIRSAQARPLLEQMGTHGDGPRMKRYASQALLYYALPVSRGFGEEISNPKSDTAQSFATMFRRVVAEVKARVIDADGGVLEPLTHYACGLAYFKLVLRLRKHNKSWTDADLATLTAESLSALAHVCLSSGSPISPERVGDVVGRLRNLGHMESSFGVVTERALEQHCTDVCQSYVKDRGIVVEIDRQWVLAVSSCCDAALDIDEGSIREAFYDEHVLRQYR